MQLQKTDPSEEQIIRIVWVQINRFLQVFQRQLILLPLLPGLAPRHIRRLMTLTAPSRILDLDHLRENILSPRVRPHFKVHESQMEQRGDVLRVQGQGLFKLRHGPVEAASLLENNSQRVEIELVLLVAEADCLDVVADGLFELEHGGVGVASVVVDL